MSYYNPKIYNKNNLKERDRKELEFYNEVFLNVINSTAEDFTLESNCMSPTLHGVLNEVVSYFCESLKESLGYQMQELTVATIDNYDDTDEIDEIEDCETFLYLRGAVDDE